MAHMVSLRTLNVAVIQLLSRSETRQSQVKDIVSLQMMHELLVNVLLQHFGETGQNGDGSVAVQV